MSLISVDLPDPDAPVTAINAPSGKFTVRFFRLFSRAPVTVKKPPGPTSRRLSGSGISFLPLRYAPVREISLAQRSSTVPCATTSPPWIPGPGPISITQSAARIVSVSCSTTITVLPMSRSRRSVAMSFSLSLGCSPMDGSSKT